MLLSSVGHKENADYSFASGNIADYLSEIKIPKQEQDIQEEDGLDELENFTKPEPERREIQESKSVSNVAGSALALLSDSLIPMLLAILLKASPETFKATKSEYEQIEQAFSDYTQQEGIKLPPWLVLIGTLGAVYGFKAHSAIAQKKEEQNELLKASAEKEEKED